MADEVSGGNFELPIEWYIPDDLVSQYATNIVVQQTPHEFIISFFESYPPIVLGSPEEQREKLKSIPSVRATCVARVVVAAERMPEIVKLLRETLARYSSQTKKPE
jgi:hypothetical protein